MASSASSAPSAAAHTLPSLYRLLLRSSRATFRDDARMMAAWRSYVREKMPPAAAAGGGGGTGGNKLSDEFVKEWTDVARILRENVAQAVRKPGEDEVYQLRITKDTELGDNDTIKQGRKSQLADLAASKGILRCGGGTTASTSNNAAPSATPSTRRAFSSSSASGAASSSRQPLPLPHPTPRFPSITYLADGSSIAMTTTSPRSVSRLTKDTTNHPLWNPKMLERGLGAASSEGDSGEEQGRMERFRRRFGGAGKGNFAAAGSQAPGRAPAAEEKQWGAEALQSKRSAPSSSRKGATPSGPSATPQTQQQPASQPRKRASMFDVDDLDWMSGGRQARAGSPLRKETGKKK